MRCILPWAQLVMTATCCSTRLATAGQACTQTSPSCGLGWTATWPAWLEAKLAPGVAPGEHGMWVRVEGVVVPWVRCSLTCRGRGAVSSLPLPRHAASAVMPPAVCPHCVAAKQVPLTRTCSFEYPANGCASCESGLDGNPTVCATCAVAGYVVDKDVQSRQFGQVRRWRAAAEAWLRRGASTPHCCASSVTC